ncbi:MAG: hypothetical protein GKR94_03745 [Gammaproteobacteria bacterium]|nr:hypothetical protein [Gammaproteobacteria bacterium]
MRLLLVGSDPHIRHLAWHLSIPQDLVYEHCPEVINAEQCVLTSPHPYDWVLLASNIAPPMAKRIANAVASRRGGGPCLISTVAGLPKTEAQNEDDEADRWRHIFAIASKSPESYPALRDACGARPLIVQYHAPTRKQSVRS